MTITEALTWAKKLLKEKNVEGPENSAEFLLRQVIGQDKTYLFTHPDHELTTKQLEKYQKFIARRAKHEPIWYITGKITFLGLDLVVNQNVLIPRPETELLVEKILEHVRAGFKPKKVLEIGTGSGAIILSLFSSLRGGGTDVAISFSASDISDKVLAVAEKNANSLGFSENIIFHAGNLFEPWKGQKFDLIVANLPYVPDGDKGTLAPDLTNHEPHLALFGGVDGLDVIREFIAKLPKYLNKNGKVFCEIGYEQGEKIQKILAEIMPEATVTVLGDYAGIDRIVIVETE